MFVFSYLTNRHRQSTPAEPIRLRRLIVPRGFGRSQSLLRKSRLLGISTFCALCVFCLLCKGSSYRRTFCSKFPYFPKKTCRAFFFNFQVSQAFFRFPKHFFHILENQAFRIFYPVNIPKFGYISCFSCFFFLFFLEKIKNRKIWGKVVT